MTPDAPKTHIDRPCHHRRTTYNEQDGTLYCEVCKSWVVVPEPGVRDVDPDQEAEALAWWRSQQ